MGRYLDHKMRRERDMRNPYGSRGGYVTSRRDRLSPMDGREPYNRDYGERYPREQYRGSSYSGEQYPEYNRPMQFAGYGQVQPVRDGMYPYPPMYPDYKSGDMEGEYREKIKDLTHRLEKYDKFKLPKQEVINQAKAMGASFKDYNEEDFIAVYYMLMSDYKMDILNNPQAYEKMAIDWLEDDDVAYTGCDKLCAYIDEIIEGE